MRSNIKLGTISGIEIGLHYSWFIIAAVPNTSRCTSGPVPVRLNSGLLWSSVVGSPLVVTPA